MTDPQLAFYKATRLEQVARQEPDENTRARAVTRALLLQSEALLRIGHLTKARTAADRAKAALAKLEGKTKLLGDLLLTSAAINSYESKVALALTDYHAAFQTFRYINDLRGQIVSLLSISYLYDDAKDHQAALRYINQALELGIAEPKLLLALHNNSGTSLAALGRSDEAVQQFRQALTLAREIDSSALEAQILRNIVRAHLAEGKLDVAERVADEAMAAARRAGGSEEPAMLSAAAQLEFQRGRLASALELINQSFAGVDLAKTAMSMREPHATAHRIHRAVGNAPEALAHLEALKRLDDESTKLATQTSTALMGARFDFANQELRIARLKAEELRRTVQHEQDRARTERTIFGIVAAAGSILVGVLVWGLVTARRSRNEVQAARDDLAVTNSALGEALAAKTEFLATTSHEIRTPLNGIMGMTEVMLVDEDLPDGARERLRLVHGAGKTMKALIDDILDVAKIEGGKMSLESAPFDLGEVLRDATLLWEDQIRAQGVEFDVDIDLPPGRVLGDSARLRQIVFNLLSNAAKFTESGAIAFNAAPDDDGNFRIQVRDTGVGIPEDKLEQVFESFRQADASVTRRFGGTGLGLSISRSLARTMGGELAVASRVGEGSVFTLTVPLASHADEPVASTAQADTVLIVDRNPVMRAMLRNLVSPHADRVVAVGAVDEALAAIAAHAPGAVLVDENMAADDPELRILACARRCGTATLLLRSSGPDGAAPVGVEGVHVVAKPVTGPALIATMFSARVHQRSTEALVSRAA